MIKKIPIEEIRIGMYLEKLPGSWLERSFWRSSFMINDVKTAKKIIETGCKYFWIDTEKGRDVATAEEKAKERAAAASKNRVDEIASFFAEPSKNVRKPSKEELKEDAVAKTESAMATASAVMARSKEAVDAFFSSARAGQPINMQEAQKVVDEIVDSVEESPHAMVSVARKKEAFDFTAAHAVAVCSLMVAMAKELKLSDSEVREAGLAGLMHDLGIVSSKPEILRQHGMTMTSEALFETHHQDGYELLLKNGDVSQAVLDVCLHHHEAVDGSGVPGGLKAAETSQLAKMAKICDMYDSMTSDHDQRVGMPPPFAIRQMLKKSDTELDATLLEAFVRTVGVYAVGSLVRLKSDKLAIVMEQSTKSLTMPKVKVFYSIKSELRVAPEIVDLSTSITDEIVSAEDPAKWRLDNLDALWR